MGKAGEAYAGKFTRKIQGLRAQNVGPLGAQRKINASIENLGVRSRDIRVDIETERVRRKMSRRGGCQSHRMR
jgi:hypothetical protein